MFQSPSTRCGLVGHCRRAVESCCGGAGARRGTAGAECVETRPPAEAIGEDQVEVKEEEEEEEEKSRRALEWDASGKPSRPKPEGWGAGTYKAMATKRSEDTLDRFREGKLACPEGGSPSIHSQPALYRCQWSGAEPSTTYTAKAVPEGSC